MLRTRLALLALAAGLSLTSGCMNFPRPFGCGFSGGCCCPPPAGGCCPPADGCCDGGLVSGYGGFGGVVGTPCCSSHAGPPGAVEGPILVPPNGMPPNGVLPNGMPPNGVPHNGVPPNGVPPNGVPPVGLENGGLAPNPNPRLVPLPQAPVTPYTPTGR